MLVLCDRVLASSHTHRLLVYVPYAVVQYAAFNSIHHVLMSVGFCLLAFESVHFML